MVYNSKSLAALPIKSQRESPVEGQGTLNCLLIPPEIDLNPGQFIRRYQGGSNPGRGLQSDSVCLLLYRAILNTPALLLFRIVINQEWFLIIQGPLGSVGK